MRGFLAMTALNYNPACEDDTQVIFPCTKWGHIFHPDIQLLC